MISINRYDPHKQKPLRVLKIFKEYEGVPKTQKFEKHCFEVQGNG